MSWVILHLPLAREMYSVGTFTSKKVGSKFLEEHSLFYLKEQDVYISYENSALADIAAPVEEFISRAGGYHIQQCECELIER